MSEFYLSSKTQGFRGGGALGFVTLLMSYSNNNGLITSIDLQTDLSVTEGSTVY